MLLNVVNIFTSELDQSTPCFVVCAAWVCSWLEQYTKIRKTEVRGTKFCYYICNWTASNAYLVLLFVLLGSAPDWNNIQKLRQMLIHVTKCCYYIYNWTGSNAHLVLLCVLLGYVPDWNNIRKLGKLNLQLLIRAMIFATQLHQMHTLFCCLCCWVLLLTGTIYKN